MPAVLIGASVHRFGLDAQCLLHHQLYDVARAETLELDLDAQGSNYPSREMWLKPFLTMTLPQDAVKWVIVSQSTAHLKTTTNHTISTI